MVGHLKPSPVSSGPGRISIPPSSAAKLPILRRHLAGRLQAWAPFSGALKPLDLADRPDAAAEEVLPKGCTQLWTRRDAQHAWE